MAPKITMRIEDKELDNVLERKVGKNNQTSGKVTVPKELIGKTVYVVWESDRE